MQSQAQGSERRQSVRISFLAYGFNHNCEVITQSATHAIKLIDISPQGARLKLLDASALSLDLKPFTECKVRLKMDNPKLPNSPVLAEVRWTNDKEFGVKFVSELGVTVADLQNILEK